MPSDDLNDLATVKALIENGLRLTESPERGFSTQVVEVRGGLVIKYGPLVWKSEFLAMELVRRHTSIPVPEPLSYLSEEDGSLPIRIHTGYLVMKKVPGVPLVDVLEGLGEEACASTSTQLMQYLLQLRTLDSYGQWGMVGKNNRFHQGHFSLAPWLPSGSDRRSIANSPNPCVAICARDIFDYFTAASPPVVSAEERQAALDKINLDRPSRFTHGDLLPEKIMVDISSGHATITGIIDWELAGWYPYFWDYWVAIQRQSHYRPVTWKNWQRIFTSVFELCPQEALTFSKFVWWTYDGYSEGPIQ